jgi:adenylate kinase
MMHKILILGPQGSGKGTQATRLSQKLNIPALSMGNLLRDEVASGSDLGKQIASYIDEGNLVPDEITSEVLKKRLAEEDVQDGFILDGYPRFMEQYEASKSFLNPTAMLVVDVPKEESIKRIMKRAETENRSDDTPESIETRLAWSQEKTKPVIEEFKKQGIVHEIDGMGEMEDVEKRIDIALGLE